jgi:hypothetical protein
MHMMGKRVNFACRYVWHLASGSSFTDTWNHMFAHILAPTHPLPGLPPALSSRPTRTSARQRSACPCASPACSPIPSPSHQVPTPLSAQFKHSVRAYEKSCPVLHSSLVSHPFPPRVVLCQATWWRCGIWWSVVPRATRGPTLWRTPRDASWTSAA